MSSIFTGKMQRVTFMLLLLVLLVSCSVEKPYEIKKTEIKVNELEDRLQMELNFELVNYSDKDYYYIFIFPSYIQENLITKVSAQNLKANSSLIGGAIVSVSKDGPEMTTDTIKAIVNGDLPFIEQILIGEKVNLN
jgi:hypothetical protein